MDNFLNALKRLINEFSEEQESNTPDFILAQYLNRCLAAFVEASNAREKWYGVRHAPGESKASVGMPIIGRGTIDEAEFSCPDLSENRDADEDAPHEPPDPKPS